jgi:hypothetical protein
MIGEILAFPPLGRAKRAEDPGEWMEMIGEILALINGYFRAHPTIRS